MTIAEADVVLTYGLSSLAAAEGDLLAFMARPVVRRNKPDDRERAPRRLIFPYARNVPYEGVMITRPSLSSIRRARVTVP